MVAKLSIGEMRGRKQHNNLPLMFILFSIVFTLTCGTAISHALTKHKEDAIAARDCIDKNGPDFTYVKSLDEDRKVQLCFIGLNPVTSTFQRLAIRVLQRMKDGSTEEITAYTNSEVTTIEKAIEYIEVDAGKYGFIDYIKPIWLTIVGQFL
jgi:hypothetical protein